MAHQLAQNAETGEYLYAYKGEMPWHADETNAKLLPATASNEEVCNTAGFDRELTTHKVHFYAGMDEQGNRSDLRVLDDQVVVMDPLTDKSLGIVSSRFKIHQRPDQRDLACRIAKALDGEIDSAGIIFDGAGTFINIRVGKSINVVKGDKVTSNFLICGFNDGTMATQGRWAEIRTVCNNTMSMNLADGRKAEIKMSHRQEFDIDHLYAMWEELNAQHLAQIEDYKLLSQTGVTMNKGEELIFNLFNSMRPETKRQESMEAAGEGQRDIKNRASFKQILDLFDGGGQGADIPGVKGTAWGLFNAVTEFVDHWSTRKSDSHRWDDAQFGKGAKMKSQAFEQFMSFAKNKNGILVPEDTVEA